MAFPPRGKGRSVSSRRLEIDNQRKPLILECELTFVNDQPSISFTTLDHIQNFVERMQNIVGLIADEQLQCQKGSGQLSGNGDRFPFRLSMEPGFRATTIGP